MKLETEYEEAAADNASLLWTKFYGCTFRPSQSVSSFLTELEQIAFRLKSLNIAIDDNQIMANILISLPPEFRVFGFAWESTPVAEKSLKKLTTLLIALDKSLRNDEENISTSDTAFLNKPKRDEPKPEEHKEQALPAQYSQGKGRGHPSNQHSGAMRTCWECDSTTYIRAECRQYKRRREREEEEADRKRKRYDRQDRKDDDRRRHQRDYDRHRSENGRDKKEKPKERKEFSYKSTTDQDAKKKVVVRCLWCYPAHDGQQGISH